MSKHTNRPNSIVIPPSMRHSTHADDIERLEADMAAYLANAKMIAAAPDLLDVAEMVLALATIDTPPELIKAATAAIAKARGAV